MFQLDTALYAENKNLHDLFRDLTITQLMGYSGMLTAHKGSSLNIRGHPIAMLQNLPINIPIRV